VKERGLDRRIITGRPYFQRGAKTHVSVTIRKIERERERERERGREREEKRQKKNRSRVSAGQRESSLLRERVLVSRIGEDEKR